MGLARSRMRIDDPAMKAEMAELVKQGAPNKQVMDMALVAAFQKCYDFADQGLVDQITQEGLNMSDERVKELVMMRGLDIGTKAQMSPAKWKMVKEVIDEEKEQGPKTPKVHDSYSDYMRDQGIKDMIPGQADMPGQSVTPTNILMQICMILVVFGVVFGFAWMIVQHLSTSLGEKDKKVSGPKSSKAERRASQLAAQIKKKSM